MTHYRSAVPWRPRRGKFLAQKTVIDGHTFDSKSEAKRWLELKTMEKAGLISDLGRQKVFPLIIHGKPVLIRSKGYPNGRAAVYRCDFHYFDLAVGETVVEEHKGFDDTAARLRRAVVEAIYGIRIFVSGAATYQRTRARKQTTPDGDFYE